MHSLAGSLDKTTKPSGTVNSETTLRIGERAMTNRSWMRRRFLAATTAALGAAGIARPAAAATVIRWATVLSTSHPFVSMMDRVAKQVKEDTDGSLEIQIFPGGQLGSSQDVIEATATGTIQMVDEGAAQFGQFVPQFPFSKRPISGAIRNMSGLRSPHRCWTRSTDSLSKSAACGCSARPITVAGTSPRDHDLQPDPKYHSSGHL
jgi:hypothetical protein